MGAGLLPVAMKNGKLYFLFGEERQRPGESARGWADFGGGPDKGENDLQTAAREGSEELTGFLGSPSKVKKLLKGRKVEVYVPDNKYRTYIVPHKYSPDMVTFFNAQAEFFKEYIAGDILNKNVIYEKSKIKWYSISEMKREKKKFRNFYKKIVDEIIKKEDEIRVMFEGRNKKKKTRKNNDD